MVQCIVLLICLVICITFKSFRSITNALCLPFVDPFNLYWEMKAITTTVIVLQSLAITFISFSYFSLNAVINHTVISTDKRMLMSKNILL